jgi:TPR repeat protein
LNIKAFTATLMRALLGLSLLLSACERPGSPAHSNELKHSVSAGLDSYRAGKLEEAKREWKHAADKGDASAAYYLGVLASEGPGGDADEAFHWFLTASEKGHPGAQYNLALAYERGLGVTRNREQALKWLNKSAKAGNSDSQYMLGLLLLDRGSARTDSAAVQPAMVWFTKAANAGNARAMYQLGTMYYDGELIDANAEKAMLWYKQAIAAGEVQALRPYITARDAVFQITNETTQQLRDRSIRGDAAAQHALASRYLRGLGAKRDVAVGMAWLRKSADQHFPAAEYDLAIMMMQQVGKEKDAMALMHRVAVEGFAKAEYALGQAYLQGNGGIEKNEGEAIRWNRKAADQALPEAEYAMGFLASEGIGMSRDDSVANSWFTKAASHGHAEAAFRISTMYANGEGVAKDPEEQRKWQCRATLLGNERALEGLASTGGFDQACQAFKTDMAAFASKVLDPDVSGS